MTQYQALAVMRTGSNIFLTGPPGSGKTFLLNQLITSAHKRHLKVAVTATTGIAATHLNGITINSWAGIGIKSSPSPDERRKLLSRADLQKRYRSTDILVIDEISMLEGRVLDLVNSLAKYFRDSSKPMGGLQIILVGDLLQLPPVSDGPVSYVSSSKTWSELELKVCYLEEQHRQQEGDELTAILNAIRQNRLGHREVDILRSKLNKDQNLRPRVLRLYSHNQKADDYNRINLKQLLAKEHNYRMRTEGKRKYVLNLQKSLLAPETLSLKVGCQVIFTANSRKNGYVNGDRGRVVDFQAGWPIVRLFRSGYLRVETHQWQTELDGLVVARAWQLPLKLAWAITIHKSQGMSLEEAQIDLERTFSPGMGYVALSRLKNIDGLTLLGLNMMALRLDSNILKVDKLLHCQSDELSKTLSLNER